MSGQVKVELSAGTSWTASYVAQDGRRWDYPATSLDQAVIGLVRQLGAALEAVEPKVEPQNAGVTP
jgi:hypothetical protein